MKVNKKIYISLIVIAFLVLGGIIALVTLIQFTDSETKIVLANKSINDQALQIKKDNTLAELNMWQYVQFPNQTRLDTLNNQRDTVKKDIDDLKTLAYQKSYVIIYPGASADINNIASDFSSMDSGVQLIVNAANDYLAAKTNDDKLSKIAILRDVVLSEEKKYNVFGFDNKVDNIIKKENARIDKDINDRQNYLDATVWLSFGLAILYLVLIAGIAFWLNSMVALINKSYESSKTSSGKIASKEAKR